MKMRAAKRAPTRRQEGFSLIEVMIAVVVVVIGLVGVARMQAVGLSNTERAYKRSQATVLAYDIADRIRANIASGGSYLTSHMTLAQATVQADCGTTSGCSPAAMAENDLYQWKNALAADLPSATGTITMDASGVYTISIAWDDDLDGDVDADDPTMQVSFEP